MLEDLSSDISARPVRSHTGHLTMVSYFSRAILPICARTRSFSSAKPATIKLTNYPGSQRSADRVSSYLLSHLGAPIAERGCPPDVHDDSKTIFPFARS